MGTLVLIVLIVILAAIGDYTLLWICGGALVIVLIASLFAKGNRRPARHGQPRTRIPHLFEADEYACPYCGIRFKADEMFCPHCGVGFSDTKVDYTAFDEEEDEMEAWDEEEGL